jgi:hypothetical protein
LANEFKKAFKGIDGAIKQGSARALNRALSATKTKMVRALREDTGLKTEVIKTRTWGKKAKVDYLDITLGIAIKFAIALSKFSPAAKRVKSITRGLRQGVTAKVGKGGRQLVPGAFTLDNSKGLAVVGRKAAYSATGEYVNSSTQSTLKSIKTEVFTDSAKANEADAKAYMRDTFEKIVAHEIDYAIQSKFSENK